MEQYLSIKRDVVKAIAVVGALFHVYVAVFGGVSSISLRSVHLAVVLSLVFLGLHLKKKRSAPVEVIMVLLALAGIVVTCYLPLNYEAIALRAGRVDMIDSILGMLAIILVVLSSWFIHGPVLPVVSAVFFIYGLVGPYMPYPFTHRGFSWARISSYLFTTANGIFGAPIDVSARYIVLFLLFANFMASSGASKMFDSIGNLIASKTRGGAAKSSVVASALFGMISGTPIANVLVTGSFTIPMMRATGFSAEWAAAVEATSSTGGLIMPPIMGAAAFLMAEILGVGYGKIMLSAIIPAILYYLSLYIAIDMHAGLTMKPAAKVSAKSLGETFSTYGHSLVALAVFLGSFVLGISPFRAAFYGFIAAIICSWLRPWTRMKLSDIIKGLEDGMMGTVSLGVACANAGIIVGMISLTGLGFTFGSFIQMLGRIPILALAFVTLLCLILGMGMPAMAAYVIVATIGAPALNAIGFPMLAVHFFIFYFTCFASVTPPVALATYTAAGLAKADPWKTGWIAFRLALVAFLAPFIFIYSPVLLLDGDLTGLAVALPCAILGTYLFTAGIQGYFIKWRSGLPVRLLLVIAGVLFIDPRIVTSIVALVLALAAFAIEFARHRVAGFAKES